MGVEPLDDETLWGEPPAEGETVLEIQWCVIKNRSCPYWGATEGCEVEFCIFD